MDEAHAEDHGSCVDRLINEELYGVPEMNPAYQNPDRRGRAQATLSYTRRSRMERLIIYTDVHLRIRILIDEAGRRLRSATRDDRGWKG